MEGKRKRLCKIIIPILIIFAILLMAPQLLGSYMVTFLFLLFMYVVLAESYDIVGGYLGYMNLGHSVFFGIGAYTAGILISRGAWIPLCFILAAIVPVVFAAAISYPFFRLRGAYFAIATFGLVILFEHLTLNLDWLTGGAKGLSIPVAFVLEPCYYMALALATLAIIVNYKISASKFGLALTTIREDEEVAMVFGINPFKYKCLALMISASFPGFMGGIYVWWVTFIHPPSVFGLEITLAPVVMAMLGGSGSYIGPVIGALFLRMIEELLWIRMPYLHLFTYGVILAIVGFVMPGGIIRSKLIRLPLKLRLLVK